VAPAELVKISHSVCRDCCLLRLKTRQDMRPTILTLAQEQPHTSVEDATPTARR